MQTATRWSLRPRISATLLVLALSPLATLAQDDGVLPAVREFSLRDLAPMSPSVGRVFNEAVTALNTGRFDKAGDAIGKLRLDRLSSYERGKVERVLFNVAYAEKDFTAARQHLVNALESGGLNEAETEAAREQFSRINAQLGAASPE
jgi:hypothetical protein